MTSHLKLIRGIVSCFGIFSLSTLTTASFGQDYAGEKLAFSTLKEPYSLNENNYDKPIQGTSGTLGNWFVGFGIGGQVYLGDHNRQMKLGELITPSFAIYGGRWLTPIVGTRVNISGYKIKGVTQNGSHSTGEVYDASMRLEHQRFNYFNARVDVLFNLLNILDRYQRHRPYELHPYIGIGYITTRDEPKRNEFSMSAGLTNIFRLSESINLTLNINGTSVRDRFDGETGDNNGEGLLSTTVGLIYNFPFR